MQVINDWQMLLTLITEFVCRSAGLIVIIIYDVLINCSIAAQCECRRIVSEAAIIIRKVARIDAFDNNSHSFSNLIKERSGNSVKLRLTNLNLVTKL